MAESLIIYLGIILIAGLRSECARVFKGYSIFSMAIRKTLCRAKFLFTMEEKNRKTRKASQSGQMSGFLGPLNQRPKKTRA